MKVTHPAAESQVSTATEPQPATYCIPLCVNRERVEEGEMRRGDEGEKEIESGKWRGRKGWREQVERV